MVEFDARVPSIARVYDYWLGGKDNFAADRELAERLLALYPPTAEVVRENKQFLTRAVTWVANQGISQFIDLGAGMPTAPSTQETAQAVIADARVAYVDNDPVVVSHLTALLAQGRGGVTVVDGDVRDAGAVLAEVSGGIDLAVPACVIMGSLLHFFPVEDARDLVRRYVAALAPGSYLIVSVGRSDGEASDQYISMYRQGGSMLYPYPAAEIAGLLRTLEVVPPGIVEARVWRQGWTDLPQLPPRTGEILAGVARVR
jgi:O-methyltransferase involved in polyketide biosynthesis